MLARRCQSSSRTLPIHERIALQCAKNLSKLASALPKPRTLTGHLPVLVEVRRTDEDIIYRYQVNLPPSCLEGDRQQMNADEVKALSQQLELPCLVHDQSVVEAEARSELDEEQSSALLPITFDALQLDEAPQLVMTQEALHLVHSRENYIPKEALSSFHCAAYASGASRETRDHFMATLHEQHFSPLEYNMIWANEDVDDADEQEEQQHQQLPIYLQSQPESVPVPVREPEPERVPVLKRPQAGNRSGYKLPKQVAASKVLAKWPKHKAEFKPLNRYKQPRGNYSKFNKLPTILPCPNNNTADPILNRPKRSTSRYGFRFPQREQRPRHNQQQSQPQQQQRQQQPQQQPQQQQAQQQQICPFPVNPYGSSYHHVNQSIYFDNQNLNYNYIQNQSNFLNGIGQQAPNPMDDFQFPLSAQMPRFENYSHSFELHRELQMRLRLAQDLQNHNIFDKRKCQQLLTDSFLSSQVPPELQALFHWDCCHLCHTAMRTMRNALDHYLSRTHLRRVDSWLIRYSFASGNVSEDMLRHLRSTGPAVLHCELCDLKLTSVMHARQHFYGRRHRLVERHISKPNGEGYYDKMGRWVRTNDKWLMCKMCDVIVTSESQLAIHMSGLRHRKRERSACMIGEPCDGSYVYRINANGSFVPLNPLGLYNNSVPAGAFGRQQDASRLNDLNASFYCEICNITLNHMKSVKQHEVGRNHKKRLLRVTQ